MAFPELSAAENEQLNQAPALIAVLIGGADGKLDEQERIWAEKIITSRAYAKPESLQPYYKGVAVGFWNRVSELFTNYPKEIDARNLLISNQLAKLNPVLEKLDQKTGAAIYRSYKILADEVAKSSGGFLRFGAVSAAEDKWVGLPMLTEIHAPELKIELDADWEKEDADREAEKWA
jgi:hypothetical protein